MRLFIAINFDSATKDRLIQLQTRLRESLRGNFSRPENLHLTLAFLGEVPPQRVAAVRRAMDTLCFAPVTLCFDRLGSFGRTDDGCILWCGIRENAALRTVQAALVAALAQQGFPPEERRFAAHITLAREAAVRQPVEPLFGAPFSYTADQLSLMCSDRIQGRLTYTELYAKAAK